MISASCIVGRGIWAGDFSPRIGERVGGIFAVGQKGIVCHWLINDEAAGRKMVGVEQTVEASQYLEQTF